MIKFYLNKLKVEYEYRKEGEFLWVKIYGLYIQDQEGKFAKEFFSEMKRHNCSKCLMDYSKGEFKGDTFTTYSRSKQGGDLGFSKNTKFAGLFTEVNSDVLFFKTVFENRGYNVRIFSELNSAITWLTK